MNQWHHYYETFNKEGICPILAILRFTKSTPVSG